MSGRTEREGKPDALLDGDAVREALEQFDTIVDLDRRVEDAADAAETNTDPEPKPAVDSKVAPAPAVDSKVAPAPAVEPNAKPKPETSAVRRPGPGAAPSKQAADTTDSAELERHVDSSLAREDSEPAAATRPKLVPRIAEPELVGIDGDELAWADDPAGSSAMKLVAGVIVVLLLGAAGVVFLPHWLEGGAADVAPTPVTADVDPIAYRAPKLTPSPHLTVAAPQPGAVRGEPLPPLPAATTPPEVPALLAAAVAAPPPVGQAATLALSRPAPGPATGRVIPPAPRPATPAPTRAAPPAAPTSVAPRALGRVEPAFTAEDTVEQAGPRIVLRVLVDERGAPIRVMVKEGVPGTGGVAKAIDAVLRTRYEAGHRQGEPVRAWLLETFELP